MERNAYVFQKNVNVKKRERKIELARASEL